MFGGGKRTSPGEVVDSPSCWTGWQNRTRRGVGDTPIPFPTGHTKSFAKDWARNQPVGNSQVENGKARGALTARPCSCLANRADQSPRSATKKVAHSTVVLKNPATPQPFRPLRFSKRPFSAAENLPPLADCGIDRFSEEDVFQGNEKAGSGKPDGRDPPGTPQSTGCG